jgi:3-hydroxyacyl-CoA dehydrogenase/enoyl-CoA hydratase/3-hydroxybutyryl-CoA epimerase
LALACRYRIADDDPKVKLGLPEVKLGIHPGFGGSLRSIRVMGAMDAMNLMLTGRNLNSRAAKRLGLIDYVVPKRHFVNAAVSIINNPPKVKRLSIIKRLASYKHLRPWLARLMVKKVAARASRTHYPAPYALIDLWVNYFDDPKEMLVREAKSVARLITGRTARNLIRVFMLQEQLKSMGRLDEYKPKHIHVVGGGVMGGDIAAWCAFSGFMVTIQDTKKEALASVIKRAYELYNKRLKVKRLVTEAMDRLIPDPKGHGLRRADIVIEAIFEDVEVKKRLFSTIESIVKPDAVLATNTSSIPLDEISVALSDPSRLVGLHFFNPVALMPLVEIVNSPTTGVDISAKAASFTRQINKLPLPVTSTPGFLVNRILMPYLMEAMILVDEGVPLPVIDKAATDFGMPMGPVELADTVGLDICLHVAENLSNHMNIEVPEKLKELVNKGRLGRKSGQGFYVFKKGKPIKPDVNKEYKPPADIQDRMILRFLNEATSCLHDKVVDTQDQADAGLIFGTGFAPFRGGPFHYISHRGAAQLKKMLEHLQQRYGPRFSAVNGWDQLEKN